jgi:beta-carotene 3-hydroxylase
MLLNILAMLFALFAMEGVAWFTHKYVMHGFLWNLHKSHHSERHGFFELNDAFSIFFSALAIGLIVIGLERGPIVLFWLGVGVSLYGVVYFVFHDVIVHRRIKIKFIAQNEYLKKIIRAHKIHHKNTNKENGEAFGFIFISKKFRNIQL